ncbi:MAG: GNAT family N-acetyltransferase [Brachybacterium sp.]|uniref:GNAT family N-acetyltransferase n=1 Tax=Brachybacterium sp. TaxID=1891286 RepID=UPI002649DA6A|nr:GNAT family protein [Brachybacterium sp.]MDN5686816.1 GNAT family N-acetyltransferase [Brachybacterium sp.]
MTSHQLRPVREDDASAILEAFLAAPDMARQGDVATLEDAEEMARWLSAPGRRSTAIARRDTDGLLGLVGVSIEEAHRIGWVFYWLHATARGRGLAARAAASVANRALRPPSADGEGGWGLERLELGHRANNPASGAVARAAGFVPEGIERQKFLIDGTRHDVHTYGRLVTDPVPATAELPWGR